MVYGYIEHDNETNPRIDEHIRGDYIWSENQFTILFDTYTDDYGLDGIPGDAHVDLPGDGQHNVGESSGVTYWWSLCY